MKNIGVIGAGTMGAGIAISAIMGGFDVVLFDSQGEALDRAHAKLNKFLTRQVDKGRLDASAAKAASERLTVAQDMAVLSSADLIIEAVFEDLSVKKTVFSQLEAIVSSTAILATNTSALKVGDIAASLTNPDRFCGLHYFSPAEINPVVEVISGAQTSSATIETIRSVLSACRKIAIDCKDQSGFALNRFFCPYTNEAVRCLEAGLGTHAQTDEVAKEALGVAIGPFAVMNIVKAQFTNRMH